MTYSEFEKGLLIALADAANATARGQVGAHPVAETVFPGVQDQWVKDAVRAYEEDGYLGPISRRLDGSIHLMLSGDGRREADRLRSQAP
jgi:hypothetical protein